jgi:hypothetical protein
MNNIGDLLGPILEVMTWVGFVLGLPLLVLGWIARRRHCEWTGTTGTVISAGGFTGYSWTDHHDADHRSLLPAAESHDLVVGSDVDLFYDVCHPSRWGLTPPKQENAAWTLGWILTGVGIVSTVGGFVLLLF